MPESKYNFDEIIDRRNTSCGKWDTMDKKYGTTSLIHLGVADMDFAAPKPVLEGLQKCIDHGVFGYTDLNDGYYDGIMGWMKTRHHVEVKREEIVFCPRINISSSVCVETFTEPGDEIFIHTPAYGPLYQAIIKNGRKVLESPLICVEDCWKMDFKQMEKAVTENTKMLILCSPHNPTGRMWTREELSEAGRFCLKHNLLLFVDEIHGDIAGQGNSFVSALTLPEPVRNILIQVSSPTKTFNVPGAVISFMVIPSEALRERVREDIDRIGMHNPNIFGLSIVENAYTKCGGWYESMLDYINENEVFTREYFEKYLPDFHIYPREGTYLLWMDYKKLGCSEEALEKWFIEKAHVSVYMGTVFQEEGRGYIRVNIASPRKLLKQAYEQMHKVYDQIPRG